MPASYPLKQVQKTMPYLTYPLTPDSPTATRYCIGQRAGVPLTVGEPHSGHFWGEKFR